VTPETGIGDETVANYNVPSFKFGAETYSRVAVDSNGYVVIGGGTSTDNECCSVQTFPNPSAPNNVIAPYWTDLDPSHGGGVYVGALSGGGHTWIVVDWEGVPAFGTTIANSFEVWIQLGDTEGQWISYGTLGGANAQPLSAGVENRDGSSGVNITPASDSEFVVSLAPPTPGGSVTFTYKASSKYAGEYGLLAALTTPLVKGITTKKVVLTVNK